MNAKKNRILQLALFLAVALLAATLPAQSTSVSGDSTINQCETKSYTIGVQNNSGNPLTSMIVTAKLGNLTGFSYVSGTASIDVDGGAPFCTANPTLSGTDLVWNVDTQCGGPFTLNDGATFHVTFSLVTGCAAVSGSLNVRIDYEIGGTPMADETGVHSIQVLPGGLTIKKTPNVIPQEIGQNVTWTLTVENSGFGTIQNVAVTDVLGAGLAYVSSAPAGSNSGQTTTWGAADVPQLASLNPGETVAIDITATVTACELLENNADARWGCDLATDCYNTADTIPPSTATASVQRIVKTPLIQYAPANITFDYCNNTATASFIVSNIGDGRAHDVELCVDLAPLTVTAVTAPATYSGGCFIIPSLAAGETFNLEFTVQFSAWCGPFPSRSLVWITDYEDDCHNHFYPPVHLSSLSGPAAAPALSVSKSGAPAIVQIGTQVIYSITSSYSGPLTCGSGSTGTVTVVDTVPDGFTVVDAGSGTWVPGGGGTGGTVTWTYAPPALLNASITVQVPDRTQCEAFCFTTFTNTVSATVVDCCGCVLNASSSQTTAIECEELADSEKTAVPGTGIRCGTIQYTNTYIFPDNAALDAVALAQMVFQENADSEQEYVSGSLQVTLSGSGDITACAVAGLTDTTPGAGGTLQIDFAGCASLGSIRNRTLTISYQLRISESSVGACSGATFYSWSQLDMNFNSGSECLSDGVISEATTVTVDPPAMSLAVSGLGQIIDKCQTQSITLTLAQTSGTANPRDVRLVLSGLNYYIVDPAAAACSGDVAPTSCTPALIGDDYVWYFADGFNGAGQNAVIRLTVQKRCNNGSELSAIAYFDDNCNDDAVYDDTCSATASETPALLLGGDLLIEKNPEVYYAGTNTVEWKIYLTNRGSGSAYNVWLDDVLGAGLDYSSAVVNNMTGVTVTADQDHLGAAINGCTVAISEMAAGQRREITFRALLIDCDNLTNDVSSSWGCGGADCQATVSDTSTVAIPRPLLINTNVITTPVAACANTKGMLTLKNSGQTTCYNLQLTATLPAGLLYIPGTTRWRLNGGGWNGPNAAYDPSPTVSPLQWTSTQISGLATLNPGDTIEVEYDLAADCPFTGGNVTIATSYENPCGQVFNTANSVFTVAFRAPQITVTKTRTNQPIGCGELIEWTITVRNTSGYTLPIIWVEDTLDAAFTYSSSVGDPPYTSDNGTFNGVNRVDWELRNVNHNDTVTLTLRATSDSSPCSPDLDNTVRVWWGCGAADGSSATKPGVSPPDNNLCLTTTGISVTRTETRQPSVGFLDIAVNPVSLNSCDDATELTVTINNPGPTDASSVDLVITLPAGLTYIANSAAVTCGGILSDPAPDPAISGSQLIFYSTASKASNLCDLIQAAGGNDTVTLAFSVRSSCYTTADMDFNLYYYDCCGDTQYNTPASQQITALYPALTVSKTPVSSQVACGADQTWNITVTNTGTGNAEVVRIEDTLGDWLTYVSGSAGITPMGGQVYGWEITNLAADGGTASFTITAQLSPDAPQASCAAALRQNNVRAIWGCGTSGDAIDGNPNTQGYDCTTPAWANAPAATLQMPDLIATAITPAISCTTDGSFSGSVSVTVRNQGDGIAYGGFTVQVSDGNGWTGSGSFAGDLAAGATTTVTIDVTSWNPDCSPCIYNFTATVDSGGAVCECNESNNVLGPLSYSPAIPDLEVASDTLAITCVADGQYQISGTVTLRNAGCSGTLTQNVPMRFTLFSGSGCTGSQIAQWTQTFTGASIAAGSTQTFTIANYAITGNACTSASGCQFSIRSEADYTNAICECDGTDNTLCSDKTFTIPDLRVDSDTLAISCSVDGQIRIQGNLVVANDGCGSNLVANIPIRISVFSNNAACSGVNGNVIFIQAGVNIPAGGTQTFAINRTLNRNLCTNSTGCQVAIGVELDYSNTICECTNANNNYCLPNITVSIPDLQVTGDTLAVTCLSDGQVRVSGTATVANTGCNAALVGNLPVRFTLFSNINCGGVQLAQWTETFAGANIAAGGSQVFSITNRDIITNICTNSTGCQLSLRIEADPGAVFCECNGGNNSRCSNKAVSVPDLRITAVTPAITCSSDGNLSGSVQVTLNNNGCGAANNIPVRLTSDCGYTFSDQTVASLAAGASTTLTFTFTPDISRCACTFTASADPDNTVCECSGANNSLVSAVYTSPVPDLAITDIDFSNVTCASDTISGSVAVTINNQGCGTANNFQVSLATDGCLAFSNQTVVSLAAGASTTLTFTISGSWVDCADSSCLFTATVDGPGSVCEFSGANNTRVETYDSNLPDLVAGTITPAVACASDGSISGSISVGIRNSGNGPVSVDFRIQVDDGQGWTAQPWFNADLGGTLPIAAGGNATVSIPWTRGFTTVPYVCSFPAISVALDSSSAICECSGGNNGNSASYSLAFPNLNIVSVTPTCSSDGSYSVAVVVNNNGCGTASNAVVRLSDNDGQTVDQTVTLAAGASQTLTFAPWPADGNPATLTFTTTLDPGAAICELSGTDNSMAVTYNNPNLHIVSITPACVADGSYQVTMVIENNGAGDIGSDFVVRLADNDGHSVDQDFTAIGGTLPLTAGSQQTVAFSGWTVDCAPTTINFSATLDPTDRICESNNGDNTNTGSITITNLQAVSVTAAASCSADGSITGTLVVTVANTGGNAITSDFRILVDDGQGWTSELFYNADLGGALPIAAGTSQSVTFNWTRAFTADPYVCSFAGITATVDSQNAICECTSADNQASGTYTLPFPDLTITSVASAVVCLGDGSLTGTTVTVANTGCAEASNFVLRLSSDCGLTFSDQTLSLAAGESRDVVFNFTSGIVGCTCNFTAGIDPDSAICELDGSNNIRTGTLPLSIPDITVAGDNLAAACSTDGTIRVDGRVSLGNLGCGPALTESIDVRFTLYGEAGCRGTVLDQWTQVFSGVNIAAGGSQNFVVRAHEISQDLCSLVPGCRLSVRVETDYNQKICEWDGTNNDRCATIDLSCLDLAFTDVSWQCLPSGAIQWTLNVTNQGNSAATNASIRIYDEAPALIFENRISIAAGATVTLNFTSPAYPPGINHSFHLIIDETNEICECNGENNIRIVTVQCPLLGEPRLEIKKTCPPAQQPGGIFRFEIEVRNSGDGSIDDVQIEDILPTPLQYVSGSSALDGKAIADPSGTTILTWTIGSLEAGASHLLVYSLIAPADADPGRYCNQARVLGSARDGRRIESEKATCCIVLRREAAGCCLVIEERPMGFVQYPELALAYIEPYFHTEKAMFTSYAALHLWENVDFEKGSLAEFVRERLKNYALSNVEELYFHSRLGLTLPDGTLWLSYAGDYPQKERDGWKNKNTMRSMSPAQVAFELLAMNKAAAREETADSKDKLNTLIAKKLDFVATRTADLPERWDFVDGQAVRQKENANLYDRASLYFSMVELGNDGRDAATGIARRLRMGLSSLDNEKFDGKNFREECLFILALKENGEDELAAKKILEFEKLFKAGQVKPEDLAAYALAVYTNAKAGGTLSQQLFAEMKSKFYSGDIGLFAQPQADFRQKIDLETLAPLILAFESQMPGEKDLFATTLYRTIEETGLFLKKTNLQVQRPPLNLIKNYPFTQEMLPLLTFIKSYDDMAPIFSETAMVQSPHSAPLAENLLPVTYTKVFAPQYETDTAQIGLLSFSLQRLGRDLDASSERSIREQGRSLDHSGKKYARLLLASRAGLEWQGDVFLSAAKLALKSTRQQELNLEAPDSKNEFSTAVLANKLVAEKLFLDHPGQDRQRLEGSLAMQKKLLQQFKTAGFVPATFTTFKTNESGEWVMLPGREKADKLTVAKLQYAVPDVFWQQLLEKETGTLSAQDLLFISLAPQELRPVFEKELQQFLSGRARDFAEIAAQAVTRKILGLDQGPALEKLADVWDHETGLPLSARLENMNRGQVFRYQPWQILIYLTATKDRSDFQFKRTLDYFTYLLESEWGMNQSEEYDALPAAEYWLVKEAPREYPEPGDLLNFNVRVENRCPNGLASAGDLPSLFIKADFTPSLVFAGSELPSGLDLLKPFSWSYRDLQNDSYLQYTYQTLIPRELRENYLQGNIWVRGYRGYQPFGPESASGEYCESFAQTARLQLMPQDLIPGLVYADRNLNGRKDAGETGIAAIRFKDNRGRLFRSNAEGRFFVAAGQENVAVQIDFRSIPDNLVLISPPTQLTNRVQRRELTYALVPCHQLRGFVFRDDDQNGRWDENEPRLVGIRLKAGDKECSSGSHGEFTMNNLPDLWRELLKVADDQPFFNDPPALIRIQIMQAAN